MTCPTEARLLNLFAGDTYSFDIEDFKEVDGTDIDITGRIYICTAKKTLDLTDVQATGANGFQVRYTATAEDNTARKVSIDVPTGMTAALLGEYKIDVVEIEVGTPNIVTRVVPLQTITVSQGAGRATA